MGLDASPFIYLLERHPRYRGVVRPLFEAVSDGRLSAVTSGVTLLEVLVVPLRTGDIRTAQSYELVLTDSSGLTMKDIDRDQLREAARLRAKWPRLRSPDALQLAAALVGGCSCFVTHDSRLPAIPGLPILTLTDYVR